MNALTVEDVQPKWTRHNSADFSNYFTVCQGRMSVKGTGTSGGFELTGNGSTLNYKQFEAGMFVIGKYDQFNTGVEIFKFNYFVIVADKYKETERTIGTGKNWKEVSKTINCKSLKEASAMGFDIRMHVTDLTMDSDAVTRYGSESGDWYYEFEGRFCRGSGAEKLSFVQLITIDEANALEVKKQKAARYALLAKRIEYLNKSIAESDRQIKEAEAELKTLQ